MDMRDANPKDARNFIDRVLTSESSDAAKVGSVYCSYSWWPVYGQGAAGWQACTDELFWAFRALPKERKYEFIRELRDQRLSIRSISDVVGMSAATVHRHCQ